MSYYYTGVYPRLPLLWGKWLLVHDALSQNAYLHMGLAYFELEGEQARMAFEQAANFSFDPESKGTPLFL